MDEQTSNDKATEASALNPASSDKKFGLSQLQLTQIMDFGDKSGINKVNQYGGIEDIARHLRTNLKDGLPVSEANHEERKREFGVNYIEPVPPKSFLALMYDAIQDKILLILLCKGFSFTLKLFFISLTLSPSLSL